MANKTYELSDGWYSWNQIIKTVLNHQFHVDIVVKSNMVSKIPSCFREIFADNDGQKIDYGYSLPDKRGIHIKVYDDYYKVHWDKRSSLTDPLGHLYHDAPRWFLAFIACTVASFGIGIYFGYRKYKSKSKPKSKYF